MVDPVMDVEGNTYERAAIEEWIKKVGTSPITRNPLSISDLRFNRALKCAIIEDIQKAKEAITKKETEKKSAPVHTSSLSEIEETLKGIDLDSKLPIEEGLIRVQSFSDFTISNVILFLFAGRQSGLVTLQTRRGATNLLSDSVNWTDGGVLNAAHRMLLRDLGQSINLNRLRRFVWNGNTAVYTASTNDTLNTRQRRGAPRRVNIIPISQLKAAITEGNSGQINFSESDRLVTSAVLEKLEEITSTSIWQCRVSESKWTPYDPNIQRLISQAVKQGEDRVSIVIKNVPYEVKLTDMQQCRMDGRFDTVREIRKVTKQDYSK